MGKRRYQGCSLPCRTRQYLPAAQREEPQHLPSRDWPCMPVTAGSHLCPGPQQFNVVRFLRTWGGKVQLGQRGTWRQQGAPLAKTLLQHPR